jgi:hypothetical protein
MQLIEMDETENGDKTAKWWELLDDSASFIRFHYDEIMEQGSDELRNAANIILGGHPTAVHKKEA